LTSKALISGYESKTGVKINGIMQTLDRKVLLVKDLSVLLDLDRHERDAVFSQLRTAYDGELTCGYGISRELISVKATFGLIAAVTPVIDNYQTVASLLGERFLKVRATQKRWESALKAAENGGNESEMRTQLNEKTIRFLRELKETNSFNVVPEINQEQRHTLVELAEAVALARAVVKAEVVNGELGADIEPAPEYATRLVKQLTKLTQLIAIIRGHHEIQKDDIKTVIRVGKDTILPRRLMVIDVLVKCGPLNEADIIEKLSASRQQIRTALNQLELIGIVKKHGSEYEIKEEMKPYFVTLTST
jgi:predicted transcriptional regulator